MCVVVCDEQRTQACATTVAPSTRQADVQRCPTHHDDVAQLVDQHAVTRAGVEEEELGVGRWEGQVGNQLFSWGSA